MTETKIALTTADGVADCHTFHPAGAGPWPGVISYMDRPGIRRDLFTIARRLASHGHFVALPDLLLPIGPLRADQPGYGLHLTQIR
jgi:carboxymethylenebutenolidase